jgi:hypothetical protein
MDEAIRNKMTEAAIAAKKLNKHIGTAAFDMDREGCNSRIRFGKLAHEMVEAIPHDALINAEKILLVHENSVDFYFGVFLKLVKTMSPEEALKKIYLVCNHEQTLKKITILMFARYNLDIRQNLIFKDFLTWKTDMKFDVVVGNPPYQDSSAANGEKGNGNTIWQHFVTKSFNLCVRNGFVSLLHPGTWRSHSSRFGDWSDFVLRKKQIEELHLHSSIDGRKAFGAGTGYDWYIAKNCAVEHETCVTDFKGNVQEILIDGDTTIPNEHSELLVKLAELVRQHGGVSCYRTSRADTNKEHSTTPNSTLKHKVFNGFKADDVNEYYVGFTLSDQHGVPKVLTTEAIGSKTFVDKSGEYCTSGKAIVAKAEKLSFEELSELLESQICKDLDKLLLSSQSSFRRAWKTYPKFLPQMKLSLLIKELHDNT